MIQNGRLFISHSLINFPGMQAVPPVTVKPVIKTYSRKSKQTPYFKPSSSASRVCDPEPGAQDPKAPYVKFIPATGKPYNNLKPFLVIFLRIICDFQ